MSLVVVSRLLSSRSDEDAVIEEEDERAAMDGYETCIIVLSLALA